MRKLSTLLVLTLLIAAVAIAADTPKDKAAQQKAAMDAMMRAATPGEAHKKLNAMAGTFDAKLKMWMEAGAPPMYSWSLVSLRTPNISSASTAEPWRSAMRR